VFDDGFENFYTHALPILEIFSIRTTIFPVVQSLDSRVTWDVYAPQKQLTKIQLRIIADAGHEIGSHTLSHPALTMIPNKELHAELAKSKTMLEEYTGKPVRSISFPFGSWDKRVWDFAQECGYTTAVAYRFSAATTLPVLRATGVYAFDTLQDIIDKCTYNRRHSIAWARSRIMPHFAKGTPVWKFRKNYDIMNLLLPPGM
jgi:peptidoglycan/xylan/chitin deacetylase (PgdA/CDA1 family)